MPWVRFDDVFPTNRKVDGLSDTAFRLHVSAIFWCARNLTDGCVPEEDLELVTARVRAPARFAAELVGRGLWHPAGSECPSPDCPPSGPTGWMIHDYLEFQPSKQRVLTDREGNAERQRRWRERNALHPPDNASSNGVSNGGSNSAPTRPDPKKSSTNSSSPDEPDSFADFWDVYPFKRGGRTAALKAYRGAIRRATPEAIQDGAQAYRDHCARERTEERYVAHAATWLNQSRWDEFTEKAAAPAKRANFAWEN